MRMTQDEFMRMISGNSAYAAMLDEEFNQLLGITTWGVMCIIEDTQHAMGLDLKTFKRYDPITANQAFVKYATDTVMNAKKLEWFKTFITLYYKQKYNLMNNTAFHFFVARYIKEETIATLIQLERIAMTVQDSEITVVDVESHDQVLAHILQDRAYQMKIRQLRELQLQSMDQTNAS